VPFLPTFVRSQVDGVVPPLARLIQGGQGGEVRLKLYLCITMMATAKPYDIRQPPAPHAWARMLALPPDTGPRRVNSNLKWLSHHGFIELEPRRGNTPAIKLVSAETPGTPYVRASTQGRYVGIPNEFWRNGWILHLSATGIALLFALLEAQGGYKEPRYITKERRDSYGFSHNTWTRGRKELERHGFLMVKRTPQGSDFDYRRLRNSYWVDEGRFMDAPGSALPPGSPPSKESD
jgi:hypothetical protein